MKKFLFLLLFLIPFSSFSQEKTDSILKGFYSRVDPNRTLQCCDSSKTLEEIKVSFLLPEGVYPKHDFSLNRYYEENLSPSIIDEVTTKLVSTYYRKFSDKKTKKFKNSCYNVFISNNVQDDITCDVIFIVGRVHIEIKFE
jgi:hypothetical protein